MKNYLFKLTVDKQTKSLTHSINQSLKLKIPAFFPNETKAQKCAFYWTELNDLQNIHW